MKAAEEPLEKILHAPNQFIIPVFQRYYVWKKKDWRQLWDDLILLLELSEENRRHFMGSIVCVPQFHQPGGLPGFQVIDGQQRLITLSLLLCAMRDTAIHLKWKDLADEI